MASIKLHIFVGDNDGSESCDFRGDNFIGSEQGDEHRTVAEIDPASEEQIGMALEFGPRLNQLLSRLIPADPIEAIIGKEAGLRIGVWDS